MHNAVMHRLQNVCRAQLADTFFGVIRAIHLHFVNASLAYLVSMLPSIAIINERGFRPLCACFSAGLCLTFSHIAFC